MTGEWTPGPWKVRREDIGDEESCWAPVEMTGADGEQVICYDGGFVPSSGGWTTERIEANARLIALAPELAQMVDDCAVVMSGLCPGSKCEAKARELLARLERAS